MDRILERSDSHESYTRGVQSDCISQYSCFQFSPTIEFLLAWSYTLYFPFFFCPLSIFLPVSRIVPLAGVRDAYMCTIYITSEPYSSRTRARKHFIRVGAEDRSVSFSPVSFFTIAGRDRGKEKGGRGKNAVRA